jgi:hypothetical protein
MGKKKNKSAWARFRILKERRDHRNYKVETIAEYLARGGKITVLPPWKPAPMVLNPAPKPQDWWEW